MKAQRPKSTLIASGVIFAFLVLMCLPGCLWNTKTVPTLQPQEVIITVKAAEPTAVEISTEDQIQRVMDVDNRDLQFSRCVVHGNSAYIAIESLIWPEDYWRDFKLFKEKGIKKLYIYLNSPGGSSSQGFAITDELRLLRESGIEIIIQGRGSIASAAIPIFLQGTERICTKSTIFLIHPSAIVKYGLFFETLKDIESQADMMKINRSNYAEAIASRSKLLKEKVLKMLEKDTWFTADKALEWGLVDKIE